MKIESAALMAAFALVLGCTGESDKGVDQGIQLELEIHSDSDMLITIHNEGDDSVVTCLTETFLVCYHEASDGTKTALTQDMRGADMKLLGPFDTTLLPAQSSLTLRKRIHVDPQHGVDHRPLLRTEGRIFASLLPVSVHQIEKDFRKYVGGEPFLSAAVISNYIDIAPGSAK